MSGIAWSLGVLLLAVVVLWPRVGLRSRWAEARWLAARVRQEDALKHILKSEANGQVPSLDSIAGALQLRQDRAAGLLAEMERNGLIAHEGGRLRLRPAGHELALHIVRAHRLWESYLADQTGLAEADWHHRADRQEHLLSPEDTAKLAARLGNPTRDPHGDSIPDASGELPADAGQSLNAAPLAQPMLITHVEDEPEAVFAQLAAEGLQPGMTARVLEKAPERIRFWADGREHLLAPVLADNISVVPLPEAKVVEVGQLECLSDLQPGQRARVVGLATACRGPARRRLLDLGFVAGTPVEVAMTSPGGDPTAYQVRGTMIALRREQARLIRTTSPAVTLA